MLVSYHKMGGGGETNKKNKTEHQAFLSQSIIFIVFYQDNQCSPSEGAIVSNYKDRHLIFDCMELEEVNPVIPDRKDWCDIALGV